MTFWEIWYLVMAVITWALLLTVAARTKPDGEVKAFTVLAVMLVVYFGALLWPVTHLLILASLAGRSGKS